MPTTRKELQVKRFSSKPTWETWLKRYHETSAGLWLEIAKKGSHPVSVSYAEALEVALCYGWIDGQIASVDARRYRQLFTPRRPRSKWSQINRAAVERLIAEGRVAPAGQRAIEAAQQDGRWAAAYPSPRNMTVPDDLKAEFDANPRARSFFDQLDSQNRYGILYRLLEAKKPETRQRRLDKFVRML